MFNTFSSHSSKLVQIPPYHYSTRSFNCKNYIKFNLLPNAFPILLDLTLYYYNTKISILLKFFKSLRMCYFEEVFTHLIFHEMKFIYDLFFRVDLIPLLTTKSRVNCILVSMFLMASIILTINLLHLPSKESLHSIDPANFRG